MSARKHNSKGRSKSGPPFIQVHHYVYDTAAYRSITPADRSVYMAILRRFNGSNNGRIGMSYRACALEAGVNKDTVGSSIDRLIDRGLIEIANESDFISRRAREYRLTHLRCDLSGALPSKAFLRWAPPAKTRKVPTLAANDAAPRASGRAAA